MRAEHASSSGVRANALGEKISRPIDLFFAHRYGRRLTYSRIASGHPIHGAHHDEYDGFDMDGPGIIRHRLKIDVASENPLLSCSVFARLAKTKPPWIRV
jgi:hypothetical protein